MKFPPYPSLIMHKEYYSLAHKMLWVPQSFVSRQSAFFFLVVGQSVWVPQSLVSRQSASLFSVAGQSVYLLSIILIRDLQIKIHIFFYEKIKIHIGTNGVREVAHTYYSIKMIQPKRKKRHQHTRFS